MGGFATRADIDPLVEHPLGGCLACRVGLLLNVVERSVEQRPQRLAPIGLRQDQQAGVKIDLPLKRNEICLVIGDEDSFFIDDQLVQNLVGNAKKVAVSIAGCPVAATVSSCYEGRRQALIDPELHAIAARPAARVRGLPVGRPRRGFPFAHKTATS